MHYENFPPSFLCYQIVVLVHDIPSMNSRSAHSRVKCLLHEGTNCWSWPAANPGGFCTGSEYLVWNTMWPLLSPRWTGAVKSSQGKGQWPNSLLSKHRTLTAWSRHMDMDHDKDTRAPFPNICYLLTFVEWVVRYPVAVLHTVHLCDGSGGKVDVTAWTSSPASFPLCSPTLAPLTLMFSPQPWAFAIVLHILSSWG